MATKMQKDTLKAIRVLIGEHKEEFQGAAIWRLATIAEEIEESEKKIKSQTHERTERADFIYKKLNSIISPWLP